VKEFDAENESEGENGIEEARDCERSKGNDWLHSRLAMNEGDETKGRDAGKAAESKTKRLLSQASENRKSFVADTEGLRPNSPDRRKGREPEKARDSANTGVRV
jgi:hypothetical protein